jgi:hypothetical protein
MTGVRVWCNGSMVEAAALGRLPSRPWGFTVGYAGQNRGPAHGAGKTNGCGGSAPGPGPPATTRARQHAHRQADRSRLQDRA